MVDLEELLVFYRERLWENPPISVLPWKGVVESTITYLTAYKQARLMLIDLGKGEQVKCLETAEK